MARYRIVRDKYCGFAVQWWRWYWPFWSEPLVNTHSSIEDAETWAHSHSCMVVKYLDLSQPSNVPAAASTNTSES